MSTKNSDSHDSIEDYSKNIAAEFCENPVKILNESNPFMAPSQQFQFYSNLHIIFTHYFSTLQTVQIQYRPSLYQVV